MPRVRSAACVAVVAVALDVAGVAAAATVATADATAEVDCCDIRSSSAALMSAPGSAILALAAQS